jgi:hypothetical protein
MADIIITGPPRSGTSYLCTVLNGISNCVVLNEPAEAYQAPFKVRRAFNTIRNDIIEGRPIKNKMKDGKFIEDTVDDDAYEEYVPHIENEQFHLAMKSPIFFLMMLPRLINLMPNKVRLVCVRNPIDTIASWKKSFGHLDGPTAEQADTWVRQTSKIIEHRDDVHLLIYEEWIKDPRQHLSSIPDLFTEAQLTSLPVSEPRQGKRELLTPDDIALVKEVCGPNATTLGVQFD